MNDVWLFNVGTNRWTWLSGANETCTAVTNQPVARQRHTADIDVTRRNIYVFGGSGCGNGNLFNDSFFMIRSNSSVVALNDVWRFNLNTSQWNLLREDPTAAPSYGTFNSSSLTNHPGGRFDHTMFLNSLRGLIYVFGGSLSGNIR